MPSASHAAMRPVQVSSATLAATCATLCAAAGRSVLVTTGGNAAWTGLIPIPGTFRFIRLPGIGQGRLRGSALPNPAEGRLGLLARRQMLAITPGSAGTVLVTAFPARNADHR